MPRGVYLRREPNQRERDVDFGLRAGRFPGLCAEVIALVDSRLLCASAKRRQVRVGLTKLGREYQYLVNRIDHQKPDYGVLPVVREIEYRVTEAFMGVLKRAGRYGRSSRSGNT